jgi:hypothetical protein
MKSKVLKKWRWALALTAVMALAGVAWAASYIFPGGTLSFADIPGWVNADIFSGVYTENDNIFVPTSKSENHVTVAGSVPGIVGGAHNDEYQGDVDSNVVTVTTSANNIGVAVIGAATRLGNAIDNNVVIEGGTIGDPTDPYGMKPGQVYGGYVTSGDGYAYGNTVVINDGDIKDAVVGGFIQGPVPHSWNLAWKTFGTGYAKFNTVTVNGGTLAHHIIGGRANTGYANNNEVIIGEYVTALTAQDIVGGRSVSGDASENKVYIYGEIDHDKDIKGGDAGKRADDNTVYISANNGKTVETEYIIGGDGPDGAKLNYVTIDSGTIDFTHIAGGRSISIDKTIVENNTVIIKGNTNTNTVLSGNDVAGGNTTHLDAINQYNTVRVEGIPTFTGTVKLYGGITQGGDGTVQNNTVEIAGTPKIDNNITLTVYGGGDATINKNNTVRISGSFDLMSATAAVKLYGHEGNDNHYTTVEGNTLDLKATGPLSVSEVKNFHKFIFTVPAGFNYATQSVLRASTASIGTNPTIEVKSVDLAKLAVGNSFNLFSAATLDGTYVPNKIGAIDTDGNGIELKIEKDITVLKATRPPDASTVKITDPGKFNFGTSTTARYITVGDFTWTGDWKADTNKVISGLSLADWRYFDLITVPPSSWGISPKLNLSKGTYTDTLTIEFSNGARATVPVTFYVTDPTGGGSPGGGGGNTGGGNAGLPAVSVPTPSGIVSVAVSGNTVTVTYADNSKTTYDTSTNLVTVAYPAGKFTAPASAAAGSAFTAAADGILIPDGTKVKVVATAAGKAPITLAGSAAVTVVNGRSTVSVTLPAALAAGTYDITLESLAGANPFFSAILAKGFQVTAGTGGGENNGGQEEEENTPSGSSSGSSGGCDAGLAGLAGLGLLIAGAVTRRNGKR